MLSVIMYVLLPMPLLFFAGSDSTSLFNESDNSWINAAKFLTGASAVGKRRNTFDSKTRWTHRLGRISLRPLFLHCLPRCYSLLRWSRRWQ
ncbi:putative vacuolar protein sorting-associated protein 55 [Cardamine amara subsp. amara]|uniref:Vacuolar protein sorting-associated protein 55 n=1 Tax=Cardamine amara subsp. amara TaxID=228776 RepID=A0ABD1BF14_CARAN